MSEQRDGFNLTRDAMRQFGKSGREVAPQSKAIVRAHVEALEACILGRGTDSVMRAIGIDPEEEGARYEFVAAINSIRRYFALATQDAWRDEAPEDREGLVAFADHVMAFDAGRRYQAMQVPDGV